MKDRFKISGHIFKENKWMYTAVFLLDLFYFLFLWLMDSRKAKVMAAAVLLLSAGLFFFLFVRTWRKNKKKEVYLQELFAAPDFYTKEPDLALLSEFERAVIEYAGERMRKMEQREKGLLLAREEQKEYVETWVHEI